MDAFLKGFSDELIKLGAQSDIDRDMKKALREARQSSYKEKDDQSFFDRTQRTSKNYLAAAIVGGLLTPAAFAVGRGASRGFHNKAVLKAMKAMKNPRQRKMLKKQLEYGPIIGSGIPVPKAGNKPLITTSDAYGQIIRGGLYGSLFQSLKDRYDSKKK